MKHYIKCLITKELKLDWFFHQVSLHGDHPIGLIYHKQSGRIRSVTLIAPTDEIRDFTVERLKKQYKQDNLALLVTIKSKECYHAYQTNNNKLQK